MRCWLINTWIITNKYIQVFQLIYQPNYTSVIGITYDIK